MKKIGFIGVGNMGGAILSSVAKSVAPEEILICDTDKSKVADFSSRLGVISSDISEVAFEAEMIFFCVKPQAAENVFSSIRTTLDSREVKPVIVSIMAGISIERVEAMSACPVIRIMPNLAVSVGQAMILCSVGSGVADEKFAFFKSAMAQAGELDVMEEKLIDAATAVSGCGPAYVCMFIEALADGEVKCGVPRAKAMEHAIQTVLGTAALLKETGKHPAVVKDEVTSPAGSTIEGVYALERGGFRGDVISAVVGAYERNKKF